MFSGFKSVTFDTGFCGDNYKSVTKLLIFPLFWCTIEPTSIPVWGRWRISERSADILARLESTGCAKLDWRDLRLKKRLICILLIAVLVVTMVVVSASAAESSSANAAEIYTYLTGTMGLNTAAATGIMANIYYETNFIADISVSGYYGLFMYWSGLGAELRTWCANNGYSHATVSGQMAFFNYKMQNSYQSLLGSLQSVSNTADGAYTAADLFCRQFERPANANYEANKRGSYASGTLFPKYAASAPTETPDALPETSVSYTGYISASVLNVRSGPGTGYSVISALYRGSAVSVTAESGDWCKLSSGGWINKPYVSASPVDSGSSSGGQTYYVSASALNVRSAPGTGNSVVNYLANGTAVTVVSEAPDGNGDTWCKLSSGGWVSKAYLSGSASSGSSSGYTVTASALNVRSGAGTHTDVISCLWRGSTVSIVATAQDGNGQNWGQLPSGGWVSMEHVA